MPVTGPPGRPRQPWLAVSVAMISIDLAFHWMVFLIWRRIERCGEDSACRRTTMVQDLKEEEEEVCMYE